MAYKKIEGKVRVLGTQFRDDRRMSATGSCLADLRSHECKTISSAILQLPLPASRSLENTDCFKFLIDRFSRLEPDALIAFLEVSEREFAQKTLNFFLRSVLFDTLLREYLRTRDNRILPAIRVAVLHALSPEEFGLVQDRATECLRRGTPEHLTVGKVILKSLIKTGFLPDDKLFNLLTARPNFLCCIAHPLMVQIERQLAPDVAGKYLNRIIKVTRFGRPIVEALLSLRHPPRSILDALLPSIRAAHIAPELLATLMKSVDRTIELQLVTLKEMVEEAIRLARCDFEFPLEFFARVPDAEFAQLPKELWLRLAAAYAKPTAPGSYRFIVEAAKRSNAFWGAAIAFLESREASSRLEAWCPAFAAVRSVVDAATAVRLNSLLHNLTMDELTFGHVTGAGGQKHIQSEPAQRSSPFGPRDQIGVVCIRQSVSDLLRVDAAIHPVQLCGWREIGQLLQLAPATPETLALMRAVLDAHERAVAPAIAAVLARFEEGALAEWIKWLLTGRQARRVLAMEILWTLARHCPAAWPLLAATLRRFTDDPGVPDLVGSKALRVLRDIFDAGLPAEITELFDWPDWRKIQFPGQRDAWRAHALVSPDFQRPTPKREAKLPPLSAPPTQPIVTSSSLQVWRPRPQFLRPQRLTRAGSIVQSD
jgi:hypothetical protein